MGNPQGKRVTTPARWSRFDSSTAFRQYNELVICYEAVHIPAKAGTASTTRASDPKPQSRTYSDSKHLTCPIQLQQSTTSERPNKLFATTFLPLL